MEIVEFQLGTVSRCLNKVCDTDLFVKQSLVKVRFCEIKLSDKSVTKVF